MGNCAGSLSIDSATCCPRSISSCNENRSRSSPLQEEIVAKTSSPSIPNIVFVLFILPKFLMLSLCPFATDFLVARSNRTCAHRE